MPFVIRNKFRGVEFEGSFETKGDFQECLNAIDLFIARSGSDKPEKGHSDAAGKVTKAGKDEKSTAKPEKEAKPEPTQEELDAEGKAQKEAVAEANRKAKAEKEAREKAEKEAEAAEKEAEEQEPEADKNDVPSLDEVRAAIVDVSKRIGAVKAKGIVEHFEVAKISELPEENYAAALSMAQAELAKLDD